MAASPGVALVGGREPILWLVEKLRAGVGCKFGCFLNGDSGLDRDCRSLGLNSGLGGRAPGPTVCANLGMAGVGGVLPGFFIPRTVPYDGV